MESNRYYFVIDMKSFYASIECAERNLNPFTTNLAVADITRGEGTVCLAISSALKKLGVRNRCRLYEIPKNINYIIAKPQMKKYIEYCAKIYSIYLNYFSPDDIHVYSIDECFIDVTSYLKLYKINYFEFAKNLIKEIYDKTRIPASVGIGTNMYLAKIALDILAKNSPDRIGFLNEEEFIKKLWFHEPLKDFWGISDGITKRLKKYGITNMKGIANFSEEKLYKEFGVNAELLIDHAWGIETCLMQDIKNYKSKNISISSSQILPSNYSYKNAKLVLQEMIQEGCFRLVNQNLVAKNLTIIIGYSTKESVKGSKRFSQKTNLYSSIVNYALEIYEKIVNHSEYIRKISFSFGGVEKGGLIQEDLFSNFEKDKKETSLTKTVINLKEKFGKNSILKGIDLTENATQKERNTLIGGHSGGEDQNE